MPPKKTRKPNKDYVPAKRTETSSGDHFRNFAAGLAVELESYGKMSDGTLLSLQINQLEKLMSLEKQFKETLIAHKWGEGVYRSFIKKICEENGNILTSRPYFRERQDVCIGPISKALEARDPHALYGFNFNSLFVTFVVKCRKWSKGAPIRSLAAKILVARRDIIQLNMPLAISQARIFWSKVPAKTAFLHLTFMDFIQIAADGLLSAVDKFVAPTASNFPDPEVLREEWRRFRPMVCQRIVGNCIESTNETTIHFYPKDRRKLYRAHKFLARNSDIATNYDKVVSACNRDAKGRIIPAACRTNPSEISILLNAASNLGPSDSSGSDNDEDGRSNPMEKYASESSVQPDVKYENVEVYSKMQMAIMQLTPLEQKLLRLKGV